MKKILVAAGFTILCFVLPQKASAANLSQLYFFGDSLSDNGNASNLVKQTFNAELLPPAYFNGRFSDGPVWSEYLANNLGLKSTNFAFGGATTSSDNTINKNLPVPILPGLQQEIQTFITSTPQADSNALYVILAGANDYLGGGVTNPTEPLNNLAAAVQSLASVGAKNFLVVNLPDLGKVPGTNTKPEAPALSFLTDLHNQGLSSGLANLEQVLPNTNIDIFDFNGLFNQAISSPSSLGLTNVTQSCLSQIASNLCQPENNKFLFWDDLHPTTYAHQIIAETAARQIRAQYTPEPSAALGTLALGALGAASVLKRPRKKSQSREPQLTGK